MLEIVGYIALIFLSISIVIGLYRVVKGPSMPDRVIALDTIGINLISAVAVISITLDTGAFLEVILLLGILSFITTVAFSKFLERGVVIERKRNR
ncbi:Na(+)/H(+) antiporter subunit F1 [Alkalicoccobacillus murimartini]|uniref:Multicomponent Na+:H+ antiporter subunit F n=1 Tax=Alkalicoccobacillus murimartini TaxID=171685 RepID=A0ABT9YIX1_9BACI|nr:Na(+)/H(+) antiporter subunit F1 [Alkalicoccobacillus murimartini]MDQ0207813.1 multicomponent Na+:H+ antiporter subunit F [Alkalicoccobacillus murimartini]